jgi:hypothetical protein
MTHLVLDDNRMTPVNVTTSVPTSLIESRHWRPETTVEADLVAQLPFLRRYANKLTRDREQAMDLVQDTCERALSFRHLF